MMIDFVSSRLLGVSLVVFAAFVLAGCEPSRGAFKEHCLSTIEATIYDKDKWQKYIDVSISPAGNLKRRPYKLIDQNGVYETFISGESQECKAKNLKESSFPLCEDGKFHRGTADIYYVSGKQGPDGVAVTDRVEIKIAEVRDDFYLLQRLYPDKHSCFGAFREEFLMEFRQGSND